MQAHHCNINLALALARNSKFKVRFATGFRQGGEGAETIVCFFPFVKNNVLIKLIMLGGSGGMLSKENLNGSTSETASEHLDGESQSVMPPPSQ